MTIKDDIELLKTFVDKTASLDDWPNVKEALDRIESALTPNADRQAALDAVDKICYKLLSEDEAKKCIETIRAALSAPSVPVFDGLDAALKIYDEFGPMPDEEGFSMISVFAEAARWVAEQNKGRE